MGNSLRLRKWIPVLGAMSVCLVAPHVWAAACVNGATVSSYIALGATGCQIGDQTYFDFDFTSTATNSSGNSEAGIAASGVNVLTDTTAGNEGLTFSTGSLNAPSGGGSVDATIQFDVSTPGNTISDASLSITGSVANPGPDDYLTVSETLTPANDASVRLQESIPSESGDVGEVTFNPTDEVGVVKDALVYSCIPGDGLNTCTGGDGVADLSAITENFSESSVPVPEPASMALLGSGLIALGVIRRRRRKIS